MKIPLITENESNVIIDTLIEFKNKGKLPLFGRYTHKMVEDLLRVVKRCSRGFTLSFTDLMRIIFFWERQFFTISAMLDSGNFSWDPLKKSVVKGPGSGADEYLEEDVFAAHYCPAPCPNFEYFGVIFKKGETSSSHHGNDSVGSSPSVNSAYEVDVIVIDD